MSRASQEMDLRSSVFCPAVGWLKADGGASFFVPRGGAKYLPCKNTPMSRSFRQSFSTWCSDVLLQGGMYQIGDLPTSFLESLSVQTVVTI